MRLVKAHYEIITPINGEEILKQIELAARSCYKSEDKIEYHKEQVFGKITEFAHSARVLIPKLIDRGHHAMLEFGGMITVKFIVDRGVSHELVRHRLASFAQESTRYCNYGKDEHVTFIIPCWLDLEEGTRVIEFSEPPLNGAHTWIYGMALIEQYYNFLVKDCKWSPQQARSVLPNSLKTEINVSCNLREWREIFRQRTAEGAHPQMKEVMRPLLDEFKSKIPILFDNINY